mmetsp:Transcript_17610/g.42329  ORF Transcript_17610/g.42329 Transcript_17610/m.42329 type:complete len:234 (-) Transcript_17610:1011-1712(-)
MSRAAAMSFWYSQKAEKAASSQVRSPSMPSLRPTSTQPSSALASAWASLLEIVSPALSPAFFASTVAALPASAGSSTGSAALKDPADAREEISTMLGPLSATRMSLGVGVGSSTASSTASLAGFSSSSCESITPRLSGNMDHSCLATACRASTFAHRAICAMVSLSLTSGATGSNPSSRKELAALDRRKGLRTVSQMAPATRRPADAVAFTPRYPAFTMPLPLRTQAGTLALS